MRISSATTVLAGAVLLAALAAPAALAQAAPDAEPLPTAVGAALSTLLALASGGGALVVLTGLSLRQAGIGSAGNRATALFSAALVAGVAILAYWLVGANLMHTVERGALLGVASPWGPSDAPSEGGADPYAAFFRNAALAALSAGVVGGAVAERVRLWPYLLFAALFVAIVYPIAGSWIWGGGYLAATWGFVDDGGAAVVHVVGGAAALAGAVVLGPRSTALRAAKEYEDSGLGFAGLGALLTIAGFLASSLGGETVQSAGDAGLVARAVSNLAVAAALGLVTAAAVTQLIYRKVDAAALFNGGLGAMVVLTASPASPALWQAALLGGIGGVIVTLAGPALDRAGVDDASGAVPAHLFCGVFGLLLLPWHLEAASIRGQIVGVMMTVSFAFAVSALLFVAIRYTIGLRVASDAEVEGLDATTFSVAAHRDADVR